MRPPAPSVAPAPVPPALGWRSQGRVRRSLRPVLARRPGSPPEPGRALRSFGVWRGPPTWSLPRPTRVPEPGLRASPCPPRGTPCPRKASRTPAFGPGAGAGVPPRAVGGVVPRGPGATRGPPAGCPSWNAFRSVVARGEVERGAWTREGSLREEVKRGLWARGAERRGACARGDEEEEKRGDCVLGEEYERGALARGALVRDGDERGAEVRDGAERDGAEREGAERPTEREGAPPRAPPPPPRAPPP